MDLNGGEGVEVQRSDAVDFEDTTDTLSSYNFQETPAVVFETSHHQQLRVKETSSYGKCNFVLPVTFFDIQSNLTYLNKCCPMSIKVIDCDKYPWYYKNVLRSDLHCSPKHKKIENTIENMNSNNNSNKSISIDLTANMNDKNKKERLISKLTNNDHAKLTQNGQSHRNPENKGNSSQIDFKKNKGLIGLKITRKPDIIENTLKDKGKLKASSIENNFIKPTETLVKESTKNNVVIVGKYVTVKEPIKKLNVSSILGAQLIENDAKCKKPIKSEKTISDNQRKSDKSAIKDNEMSVNSCNAEYQHHYKPTLQSERINSKELNESKKTTLNIPTYSKEESYKICNDSSATCILHPTNELFYSNARYQSNGHHYPTRPIRQESRQSFQSKLPQHVERRISEHYLFPHGTNHRSNNPKNIPSLFPSYISRFPTSRPLTPQNVQPYNARRYPRNIGPSRYPYHYQKYMSVPINVAPVNIRNRNNNWPYWYSSQAPIPPSLPPPPPPPIEENINSIPNHSSTSDLTVNDKNMAKKIGGHAIPVHNISYIADSNNNPCHGNANSPNFPEKTSQKEKNINIDEAAKLEVLMNKAVTNIKPVDSKTEMFHELQKESLKINSELLITDGSNGTQKLTPSFNYTPVSVSNTAGISAIHTVTPNKNIFEKSNSSKVNPNVSCDNKTHRIQNDKPDDKGIKDDVIDRSAKHNITEPKKGNCRNVGKITTPETNKIHLNRPRAGPLCMKNRSGPFARHLTSPPNQNISSNKGYSPPILPIPTFQKTLEMLTQSNDMKMKIIEENLQHNKRYKRDRPMESDGSAKRSKKRIDYLGADRVECVKKISLQDYQKRLDVGDSRGIVLKKKTSCKRNQNSEQDLGYDSDVTVKL